MHLFSNLTTCLIDYVLKESCEPESKQELSNWNAAGLSYTEVQLTRQLRLEIVGTNIIVFSFLLYLFY